MSFSSSITTSFLLLYMNSLCSCLKPTVLTVIPSCSHSRDSSPLLHQPLSLSRKFLPIKHTEFSIKIHISTRYYPTSLLPITKLTQKKQSIFILSPIPLLLSHLLIKITNILISLNPIWGNFSPYLT